MVVVYSDCFVAYLGCLLVSGLLFTGLVSILIVLIVLNIYVGCEFGGLLCFAGCCFLCWCLFLGCFGCCFANCRCLVFVVMFSTTCVIFVVCVVDYVFRVDWLVWLVGLGFALRL